jgi:hypothetical protein
MTAAIELVPVDEIRIEALGPAPRRGDDLAGEDADSHGDFDDAVI